MPVPVPVVLGGTSDMEVVGESYYQDHLWACCGAPFGGRVRHAVVAVLVPEPHNAHDPHAVAVHLHGAPVGYLPRDVAADYLAGLHRLMAHHGVPIALQGVIVGGGYRSDGPGMLGVWLDHEPGDFGIRPARAPVPAGRLASGGGTMRTGLSEAWASDEEDDSYDLSWIDDIPDGDRPAIAYLAGLLEHDPDPIDRHFQFAEMEKRLYRCRELYAEALDEFDDACIRHDAEMDGICAAFRAKWGRVPVLETYRQMAIRQQKRKDWVACRRWCERGLALYGDAPARVDAVEDLQKRLNRALAKLEVPIG